MKRVSTSSSGAAAELLVCADLIDRGFEVFRNLSPNGAVDLLAILDRRIYRIQVKRGANAIGPSLDYDAIAIVRGDGIEYFGKLPLTVARTRCEQKNCLTSGQRCRQWAAPGKRFCWAHEPKPIRVEVIE